MEKADIRISGYQAVDIRGPGFRFEINDAETRRIGDTGKKIFLCVAVSPHLRVR